MASAGIMGLRDARLDRYRAAVADAHDATRMTLRNRGEPAGFSKLAVPFITLAMRRANRKDLSHLKTILESAWQP